MIDANQIPDEVVEAAVNAWKKDTQSFPPNAETIAAALNAWPGMDARPTFGPSRIILPLSQEVSDE